MTTAKFLISCDWGTTSFRLYLVKSADGSIQETISTGLGIKTLFAKWCEQGTDTNRIDFYLAYLQSQIDQLSTRAGQDLSQLPRFISGMGSSSIGILELPYASLPFSLNGNDLVTEKLPKRENQGPSLLISGLRTETDVMRGEETQLIGLAHQLTAADATVILPGTHSKHVYLKAGKITGFHTYMTGEFFELLSQHSILSASIEASLELDQSQEAFFAKGVALAKQQSLLSASFQIRTNELLHQVSKKQNFHFLSGLLIGSELKHLTAGINVYICGGGALQAHYQNALEALGQNNFTVINPNLVDTAVAKAHCILHKHQA